MISAEERERVERSIRELHDAGDHHGAATLLFESYGRELLAFLIARMRDHDAAQEGSLDS